jgi:DNA topoisomerase-2
MATRHGDYERLEPLEAILRRPDTFVGSTQPCPRERFVLTADGNVRHIKTTAPPALVKIFDEILTNALDHRQRDRGATEVRIDIGDDGELVVSNNGSETIPTGKWSDSDTHVPEVLFGSLNAGSNLAEVNAHDVGGRNGVGATVAAVMSARFVVDIRNPADKTHYTQVFEHNLSVIKPPAIKPYKLAKAHTTIRMLPDYARLAMPDGLDDEARALLVGRAVDAAACTDATVYVNGVRLPYTTLGKYALAYGGELVGSESSKGGEKTARQRGATIVVTTRCDPPVHVCFVNGVRCLGTLYDAVLRNITHALHQQTKDTLSLKQVQGVVVEHVSIFVAARMNTPAFGSQSKDQLVTRERDFGFEVPACAQLAKAVQNLAAIKAHVDARRSLSENRSVKKALAAGGGRLCKNIKKFERATEGRGTLWVTEGDSAKAMVVAGFSVSGRKRHAVYPLRGKNMNVTDMRASDALKNTEISELLTILHLDPSKTYDAASVRRLPYDLMITTDSDEDGAHIFGLVLALFYRFFPSLLAASPRFVRRFVTPVVKVWLTPKATPLEFFALAAYRAWAAGEGAERKPASIAYYKGLGTNSNEEAVAYFRSMDRYAKTTVHTPECAQAMLQAFSKGKEHAAARRDVLRDLATDASHDLYSSPRFTVAAFCRHELTLFWQADNVRSIPSVLDGLKPSQRKAVYTVLKAGHHHAKHKVAQLAADVAKATNYHHGEGSLADVIVKMAQTYMGSNNLNLFEPKGQFGNRHGEKPSQPRYIFTRATPYLPLLFHPDDDRVLDFLVDEGQSIEPRHYVPTVPLLLVNGAEGIGTGFSTSIPPHAVGDVLDRCLSVCARGLEAPIEPLAPCVFGFRGSTTTSATSADEDVVGEGEATVIFVGSFTWESDTCVHVTELPPGVKTNALKDALHEHANVDDVVSESTGDAVSLRVTFKTAPAPAALEKLLKMRAPQATSNMHAFDAAGRIVKYASAAEMLRAHAVVRLGLYEARQAALLAEARAEMRALERKAELVRRVVAGEVDVFRSTRAELGAALGEADAAVLLKIPLDQLTRDGIADFERKVQRKVDDIGALERTTAAEMWRHDLLALREQLGERLHHAAGPSKRAATPPPDAEAKRPRS